MGEGERFQLGTVGALTLSVVSFVSIVICNKALMSSLHFIFATTLTSWHLLVTFCSLHLAFKLRFFEHKPFEQKAVVGFGILNGISIGLLNLSLGFNSVGFYQMTKLVNIPCTVLLELLRSHQVLHNCIQTFTKLTCSEPKAVYEPAQQHDYQQTDQLTTMVQPPPSLKPQPTNGEK